MIPNKIFGLFCLLFVFTSSFSQEENKKTQRDSLEYAIEDVVITATGTQRQLSSLPMPTQIITKEELDAVHSLRLTDILEEQTGLITVPDFGGGEGIQMQGLDSEFTLILIDGQPIIGRSAGTLDLNRISIANIEQIEIVKGASSSLYGNEALGGVINIITTKPIEEFNGTIDYRAGTFNTHDVNATIQQKKGKVGFSAFGNRLSSEGYTLSDQNAEARQNPFVAYTAQGKVVFDLSEQSQITTSARYFNQEFDNAFINTNFNSDQRIDDVNAHIRFNHKFSDKLNTYAEFYGSKYMVEETTFETGIDTIFNDFNQQFLRPEVRGTYFVNEKSTAILGSGYTYEQLDRDTFIETAEFRSPYVYGQYDFNPTDQLNVIAGFRYDNHSEYTSQLSPKLSARYEIDEKLAVRGSIGRGFKAPDFRQLYFDFFNNAGGGYIVLGHNAVGQRLRELQEQMDLNESSEEVASIISNYANTRLDAERSWSTNIGADFFPANNVELNLNLFRNDIENLIDVQAIAQRTNGQNVFSYVNIDEVFTQGIELQGTWDLTNQTTISGGYQLLYAKDKTAIDDFENGTVFRRVTNQSGTVDIPLETNEYFGLLNRSRHTSNLKVFHEIPKWKANANIRGVHRSKYGLTNGSNGYLDSFDNFVDGFIIWDVALNKQIKKHEISFGVDNLFNFTDIQYIPNEPGRQIFGNVRLNF